MNNQLNKLYVSLPISGFKRETVVARCEAAKEKYTKRGYVVITPVDLIRDTSTPYHICMGKCVEALMDCQAAVFLKGYGKSRGCVVEHTICDVYGIAVIEDSTI